MAVTTLHRPWRTVIGALGLCFAGLWIFTYVNLARAPWNHEGREAQIAIAEAASTANVEAVASYFDQLAAALKRQASSSWYAIYAVAYGCGGFALAAAYAASAWRMARRGAGTTAFRRMSIAIAALGLVKPLVRYTAWSFPLLYVLSSLLWPAFTLFPLLFVWFGKKAATNGPAT